MDLVTKRSKTQDDEYYLVLAFAERNKSDDPKSRLVAQSGVGATIVNHGQIVSQSANVLPPKLKNRFTAEGIDVGEAERYHLIEHAERAAIFIALLDGQSIEGATMYCTRYPCSDCARAIVWAGISRLVVASGLAGEQRWLDAQRAARHILKLGGVTVRVLQRVN
jgi:deoxycytidylate deaminase